MNLDIDKCAKQFFPHLTPTYGRLVVKAVLDNQRVIVTVPRRRRQSPLAAAMLMGAILGM